MVTKGLPPRVGDLARAMAARGGTSPVMGRGVRTSRVLLRGYLATAEACVRANGCTLCRRALDEYQAALASGPMTTRQFLKAAATARRLEGT